MSDANRPGDRHASPRQRLRDMRKRAHLNGTDCAKALGLAGPTGYMRYETDSKYDTDKYAAKFIQSLLPLFVGRGYPPIEEREMLDISDMGHFVMPSAAASVETPSQQGKSDREMLMVLYGALQVADTKDNAPLLEAIRLLENHLWTK